MTEIEITPVEQKAIGGGLEGAEITTRETLMWRPNMGSPDQIINNAKPMADARGRDSAQNDGYISGAVSIHRDSIVGAQYRLNSQPNWLMAEVDEAWAEEFQQTVESRFNTVAESLDCWFDASRRSTFTGLIRLGVASHVMTGEVLATAEWIKQPLRPFNTAIQVISPDRLSNPQGQMDGRNLRRGIGTDSYGAPVSYWIRAAYPTEIYDEKSYNWIPVPAAKPWGRKQVLHIMEALLPSQSRGVADMVSALKQMRMTKKFQEVTLQNAVVNATYAAAIESELPTGQAFEILGANNQNGPLGGLQAYLGTYMGALGQYLDGSKSIAIDGAKIPHLFPGTKLNMQPVGTPGGVGTGFEESLLRYIAAALGLSYEEFSRDFTKTNYSSARASMNNTWKSMQAKKKMIADRLATEIFSLWLEEEWNAGNLPRPKGKGKSWFYQAGIKDCLTRCSWIGASRGQIDELKETQAAVMRIASGLSTYEKEMARLGEDWRDVFAQAAREETLIKKLGLTFSLDAQKYSGATSAQGTMTDTSSSDPAAQDQSSGDQAAQQDQNQQDTAQ